MKRSTKQIWIYRIYRWTCKLFRYEEIYRPIYKVEKKVEQIKGGYVLTPNKDECDIKKEEEYAKNQIAIQMAKELIKVNAIKFEYDVANNGMDKSVLLRASLNFVR